MNDVPTPYDPNHPDYKPMPLSEFVKHTMHHYFNHLEGEIPSDLFSLVFKEVEKGFLSVIMEKARGNRSLASKMCGIARGTLIKKLKQHQLDHL